MQNPSEQRAIDACVERILEHAGNELVLALPLGLGKPNHLVNALYRRIAASPERRLVIFTALSLAVPNASSDLERRFLDPFLARQFGADYPHLEYVAAMRADRLPPNVRVREFYFQSGAMLGSGAGQADYASLNYTHVARDLAHLGVNVIAHLVARRGTGAAARYSLGSNPDVTLDLLDRIAALGAPRPLMVGVVHAAMPFLGGDAEVEAGLFDIVHDDASTQQRLFALPREDVDDVEHAIGLHASTLVRDGGTLQIGIGALSDALVHALLLRKHENPAYRAAVAAVSAPDAHDSGLVAACGGLETFERGLHGSSEMVMDGFMHLRRGGVLVREVHDDLALQRALDAGIVGPTLRVVDAPRLREAGVLPARLDEVAWTRLVACGLLPADSRLDGDALQCTNGERIALDLEDAKAMSALDRLVAGRSLRGGRYLQGGFFLGSNELYEWLRTLAGADHAGLAMDRISAINELERGHETLAAAQRRDARFFNTCMMATALGAAVSDALEDGRVVSGVGGQYNFVALAHALDGARSILMLRATRIEGGRARSNIRWAYGHATIPRHLRDIFVTEYGIADLRGKTDRECVLAMLAIADARFHDELVAEAVSAHKLPAGFRPPSAWQANTPHALADRVGLARKNTPLPAWPFGSDFDPTERALIPALSWLRQALRDRRSWPRLACALFSPGLVDPLALARMRLDAPSSLRERLYARLLCVALAHTR